MWNIFKKKKKCGVPKMDFPPPPPPRIGSYRIKSQGGYHTIQMYISPTLGWQDVMRGFTIIEEARRVIRSRIEIENAPVTYTEVNLEEL